ncbi:hypothetical protein CY35_14G090800 [Sphagnum magellanicum]|nr:hypothetical protein CY35_14G090800 [Sphagnum magellanicum]
MATQVETPQAVPVTSTYTVLQDPPILKTPTCTITSKKDEKHKMRAVEYHGKRNMKVRERPRPLVTDPTDAILSITTTCICGSDLHMYVGFMPGMKPGDVTGHEFMGIVESVGSEVKNLKPGDRVVSAFDIACNQCPPCFRHDYSCCDTTNPSKEQELLYGDRLAGFFGYSHLTGGWEGGQAEFARVPFADVNCLKVPDELDDEHSIFLSDILPTAWHANELGHVGQGDNVAIWGAGPVGIFSAHCALLRGAAHVVLIDSVQYRLDFAKKKLKDILTINRKDKDVYKEVRSIFPQGPDVAIEAVGFHYVESLVHKLETTLNLETDTSEIVNEIIYTVRKAGRVSIVGVYAGFANHFNVGAMMEKGLNIAAGQTPVQKYWPTLLPMVQSGKIDSTLPITHVLPLSEAPRAYKIFDDKEDGCVKVLLKPGMDRGKVTDKGESVTESVCNTVSGVAKGALGSTL